VNVFTQIAIAPTNADNYIVPVFTYFIYIFQGLGSAVDAANFIRDRIPGLKAPDLIAWSRVIA
jgi:hypothetical protein